MANKMYEKITSIAADVLRDGETMTFNELAEQLGHDPRLMGRRVGSAHKAMRLEILKLAAESGDAEAMFLLGTHYMVGTDFPEVIPAHGEEGRFEAIRRHTTLADCDLPAVDLKAVEVPHDLEAAASWFRKAADLGHVGAQYALGQMLSGEFGIPQDKDAARAWLLKAAEQDHLPAQQSLYLLAWEQNPGEGNAEEAKWAHRLAEATPPASNPDWRINIANAQFHLAQKYRCGKGEAQSFENAALWYRRAAENGFSDAWFYLGTFYREGTGVPQSNEEAIACFTRLLEHADETYLYIAKARFLLGEMYFLGEGVPQSYEKALPLLLKASDEGDAEASFLLGVMAREGKGLSQSNDAAISWFQKATDQDWDKVYEKAAKALTELGVEVSPSGLFSLEEWRDLSKGLEEA